MTLSSTTSQVDYSDFGPYGDMFDDLEHVSFEIAQQDFRERRNLDLGETLQRGTRSQTLALLCERYQRVFHLLGNYTEQFWPKIRTCFYPILPTYKKLFKDAEEHDTLEDALNLISKARSYISDTSRYGALQYACFGAFRNDEIQYIARNYRNIIELGAGSGYLTDYLMKYGVNITALDKNRYGSLNEEGVASMCEWTTHLKKRGVLKVGSQMDLNRENSTKNALLISWPEPGNDFAASAIARYREMGGRDLIFKFGKLGGIRDDKATLSVDFYPDALWHVFEELHENWQEIKDKKRPKFIVQAEFNNLFCFKVRNKS